MAFFHKPVSQNVRHLSEGKPFHHTKHVSSKNQHDLWTTVIFFQPNQHLTCRNCVTNTKLPQNVNPKLPSRSYEQSTIQKCITSLSLSLCLSPPTSTRWSTLPHPSSVHRSWWYLSIPCLLNPRFKNVSQCLTAKLFLSMFFTHS